jgi:hypothetical protein
MFSTNSKKGAPKVTSSGSFTDKDLDIEKVLLTRAADGCNLADTLNRGS